MIVCLISLGRRWQGNGSSLTVRLFSKPNIKLSSSPGRKLPIEISFRSSLSFHILVSSQPPIFSYLPSSLLAPICHPSSSLPFLSDFMNIQIPAFAIVRLKAHQHPHDGGRGWFMTENARKELNENGQKHIILRISDSAGPCYVYHPHHPRLHEFPPWGIARKGNISSNWLTVVIAEEWLTWLRVIRNYYHLVSTPVQCAFNNNKRQQQQ